MTATATSALMEEEGPGNVVPGSILSSQPVKNVRIPNKIHIQHKDFLTMACSFYIYQTVISR
jgi:hypothetical protein